MSELDTEVCERELISLSNCNSFVPVPSQHRHYQLYWVWGLKTFFLNATAASDPFRSRHFFWIDAGYFRDALHDGRDVRGTD